MNTPAIRNQYGEMNTGMPKGRAIFTPGPCSRDCSRDSPSGALPATRRCYVLERVRACRVVRVCCFPGGDMPSVSGRGLFVFEDTPGMDGQLSEGSPTLPGMGDKSATVTAEPPDPRGTAELGAAASGAGDGAPPEPRDRPSGPSLSPSRAGDFLTCPLLYRFRVIDRLPEPPSPAAVRGTLVHSVLERLFDAAAADRTPDAARALMEPEWSRMLAAEPELAALFDDDGERALWLAEVSRMLDRYFT